MFCKQSNIRKRRGGKQLLFLSSLFFFCIAFFSIKEAFAITAPTITFGTTTPQSPEEMSAALQLFLLLTVLSIAPGILLMTTCFVRIIIVFGFIRQAMSTQNMPPTQVLIGLNVSHLFYYVAGY